MAEGDVPITGESFAMAVVQEPDTPARGVAITRAGDGGDDPSGDTQPSEDQSSDDRPSADARSRDAAVVALVLEDVLPSTHVTVGPDGVLVGVRDGLPLTATEEELLAAAPAAREVVAGMSLAGAQMSHRQVLEDVLVVGVLEARLPTAARGSVPGTVLSAVRALSARREEGKAACSGVLVVDDVGEWRAHVEGHDGLLLEPLAVPLTVDERFFAHPATHHYVDGRHSLFVVGPDRSVVGILRLDGAHDPLRVAAGDHLAPALDGPPAFAAVADANSVVTVVGAGGLHLRRRTSHWRLVDPTLLPRCLRLAGMGEGDAAILATALSALSDARTGTFVLVPTADRTPRLAGVVDPSRSGAVLLTHLLGRSLRELRDRHALLGLLGHDGLTMFSSAGELLLTGAIIDLDGIDAAHSGGSRTHAAASASTAGVTLMVSADGQITAFSDGRQLLHLER